MAIPLKVAVYKGSDFIGEQRFDRDIIKIGRLASAHLKLEDPKVSRIHAVIEVSSDGQELSIIDMGSSEGTFVNGERISKEKLRDGDEIKVGECRLVLSLDASPIPAGAPGGMSVPPEAAAAAASFAPGQAVPALHWTQLAPENSPTGVFSPVNPLAAQMGAPPSWSQTPMAHDPSVFNPSQLTAANAPTAAPNPYSPMSSSGTQSLPPQMQPMMPSAPQMQMGPSPGYGVDPNAQPTPGYPQPQYAQPPYYPQPTPGYPQQPQYPDPQQSPMHHGQTDVAYPPTNGWYAGQQQPAGAWGTVPNNLASEGVPEDERALELKLVWGDSVLKALTATTEPIVTMGDQENIIGWGPFKSLETCDLDVPSRGLPAQRYPIAVSRSKTGASYAITLHSSFSGHVEKLDGTIISLQEIVAGGRTERGELPDTWLYSLNAEETLYVKHGLLTVQARYVRKNKLPPVAFMDTVTTLG